jgi:hypothetical protein
MSDVFVQGIFAAIVAKAGLGVGRAIAHVKEFDITDRGQRERMTLIAWRMVLESRDVAAAPWSTQADLSLATERARVATAFLREVEERYGFRSVLEPLSDENGVKADGH